MACALPPEWAPQQAMLLAWPRAQGDWGDGLDGARTAIAAMACAVAPHQDVILVASDDEAVRSIRAFPGLDDHRTTVVRCPADDIWARDFGPLTVFDGNRRRFLDFRFNGWGNKFAHRHDDRITAELHARGALGAGELQPDNLVLEGGSIEVNGAGALLTTRRCLLEHNRNPGLDAVSYEALFARQFGTATTHWLAHGALIGDDTDGHIDTLARFADARTIVFQGCDDPQDEHYPELREMAAQLASLRDPVGCCYRLRALPLPAPVHDKGRRLPAGYANFLIVNASVLVPTYEDPADTLA
ncbi:MAG: agmatine deiminase family protein, partial [Salinisphaera sp.]|nr:agmatine deiminase family protein [Salinisphaera sp.]